MRFDEKHRKNISRSMSGNQNKKGYKYSTEQKEKIRLGKISKGFVYPNTGRKIHSEKHKKEMSLMRRGSGNPMWKGGKKKVNGYIFIYSPYHPNAVHNYMQEHRLVIEKELGRFLTENEIVHHKNAIKDDNRLENLIVCLKKVHFGELDCPKCGYHFLIK